MTRLVSVVAFVCGGIIFPMFVFAAFVGPSSSPPSSNVKGLIWNISAADQSDKQSGAEYNISGSARIGGDFFMTDSKALRIDSQSFDENTTLNVGNWNSIGTFLLNVIGDIKIDSSDGAAGRVSAKEYCYQDPTSGDPTSCISSWPEAAAPAPDTFVDVIGDTMTGQLHLAVPVGNAIFAEALESGSIAIQAIGASYGAWFQGNVYGVEAHGNTAGLYAVDDNDGSAASIAAGGYGVQAIGSRVGVYGSGPDAGLYGIDSSTAKYGYVGYGSYSFYGNGDLSVPSNARTACVTVNVATGAGTFQCTGAKFMSGVRKNASNIVDGIVCCDL
jgi:hypothetical protein